MLVSISYFGFYGDRHIIFKLLLGVLLPIGIVVFWSFFMAPTADYRFDPAIVRGVALALFLVAATMLYKANLPIWGVWFAIIAAVNAVLTFIWNQ